MATPNNRHLVLLAAMIAIAVSVSSVAADVAVKSKDQKSKEKSTTAPPVAGGSAATFIFPVFGDVYPNGLFYVAMNIGDPPKPYFFDIDTGSHLTWLQCDAPCVRCNKSPHPYYKPRKGSLVPCNDPMCRALKVEERERNDVRNCEQCDYAIDYHDESSQGVLVSETFPLKLGNKTLRPQLIIGCGYDQSPLKDNAPSQTDGVLGLGRGAISILKQLSVKGITKNVVGHCLSSKGGGYLFFGDDYVPTNHLSWAPMSSTEDYYSPGAFSMYWGKNSLAVKQQEVVIDSGSTYTYFNQQSYQAFLTAVKKDVAGTSLKEAPEEKALPVCWKGSKPFNSVDDVSKFFNILTLSFGNGKKSLFPVPPTNYLVVTKNGNVCLGILDGEENGLGNLNVIGDTLMLDMMVVYDNEKKQIGWIRAACNRLNKSGEEDNNEGIEEGYGLPQIPSMGILTEEHPLS